MKKYLIFIFLIIFHFSCKETEQEIIPSEITSIDTMSMVLADLHIAESYSNFRGMNDVINESKYAENYSKIFSKYNIKPATFEKSYSYYLEKPERMDLLYTKVLEQLSKIQAEVRVTPTE